MAKNTRIGYRRGAVDNRSQTYNPVTEQWVKRDAQTGQFMDARAKRRTIQRYSLIRLGIKPKP